jgi:hypothetical protein
MRTFPNLDMQYRLARRNYENRRDFDAADVDCEDDEQNDCPECCGRTKEFDGLTWCEECDWEFEEDE